MSADEQRKQMEAQAKIFKANQEVFEEAVKMVARMFYTRYKYFIEAGFTESQAFDLIKHRGMD